MQGNSTSNWLGIYNFVVIIILPSIINGIFNTWILFSVRSSTQRVHAATVTAPHAANLQHHNHRDVQLLKHMLDIFVIFIIGWVPIYIVLMLTIDKEMSAWLFQILQILPVISLLLIILDLFLYNHDLRQYLQEKCRNVYR